MEWISVEEDMPDIGEEVIVYSPSNATYPEGEVAMAELFEAKNNYVYFRYMGYGSIAYAVTHWMHKPKGPEVDNGEDIS